MPDLVITCGASWSTEGNDRSTLKVDQDGDIAQLVASSKSPVAVLLTAPGALVTSSFDAGAGAVVSMFLAGQATGLAWADVLFGDTNPNPYSDALFRQRWDEFYRRCRQLGVKPIRCELPAAAHEAFCLAARVADMRDLHAGCANFLARRFGAPSS